MKNTVEKESFENYEQLSLDSKGHLQKAASKLNNFDFLVVTFSFADTKLLQPIKTKIQKFEKKKRD